MLQVYTHQTYTIHMKVEPIFCICGLDTNFPEVELHHKNAKPDVMFISESVFNHSIPVQG